MKVRLTDYFINLLFGLILVMFFSFTPRCISNAAETSEPNEHKNEYGISSDFLDVQKMRVKENDGISDILLGYNVPYSVIDTLAEKSKKVFDVRRFKKGNTYCVMTSVGEEKNLQYLIYEQNPIDFIVFELINSPTVYCGKKPVDIQLRIASGVIQSSFYETLKEQNLNYDLFVKLSEVYAWTIDFHHLQKGDKFKVLFEEKLVNGKAIGLGRILAVNFIHKDSNNYAFYFEENETGNYYDEKGRGLKKAFLKAPLKFSRITSKYSTSRFHPILDKYRPHLGIDYAAPSGTPIVTVGDGTVVQVGKDKSRGNYIKIRHNSVYESQYIHLSKFSDKTKKGVKVKQGDVIGYVGKTGYATGPHLDFRFWKNGRPVNYICEDIPKINPIKQKDMMIYNLYSSLLKRHIDAIKFEDVAKNTPILHQDPAITNETAEKKSISSYIE